MCVCTDGRWKSRLGFWKSNLGGRNRVLECVSHGRNRVLEGEIASWNAFCMVVIASWRRNRVLECVSHGRTVGASTQVIFLSYEDPWSAKTKFDQRKMQVTKDALLNFTITYCYIVPMYAYMHACMYVCMYVYMQYQHPSY